MLRYVVHSTLFYLTQVQVQEIVYFVAHCVFVELGLFFYLLCPSNTILWNFSSTCEVLAPLDDFVSQKFSGTERYTPPPYILTPQKLHQILCGNFS